MSQISDLSKPEFFVGRQRELSALERMLESAMDGRGCCLLVSGEAGMGKTTLLARFLNSGNAAKCRILFGRSEPDIAAPLAQFSQALEGLLDSQLFSGTQQVGFSEILLVDRRGLLLAQAKQHDDSIDADIFSAMFSAVQNYVAESMDTVNSGSNLGRLEYGDMSILIEHGADCFLIGILRSGEHPEMRSLLRSTMRLLEREHGQLISAWNGSMEAMRPVQAVINEMAQARFQVARDFSEARLLEERARLSEFILSRLASISLHDPVILVLEDLHWADESALFVLEYLARNLGQHRIFLLGTLRPRESSPLDSMLSRMGPNNILELGNMEPAALQALVGRMCPGNDFGVQFIDSLTEQCGGNPFYLVEMLAQMKLDRKILKEGGRHVLVDDDYELPASLEELAHRRFNSLGPDQMRVAEYSSCVGREFPNGLLLESGIVTDPLAVLAQLEEFGLVIQHPGITEFTHAIFRDVLYSGIGQRWKSKYHMSIGEYLERTGPELHLYELARHFTRAGDNQKAFEYSLRAGRKADSSFATELALEFYTYSNQLIPAQDGLDPETALDVRESLAISNYRLGNFNEALELFTGLGSDTGGLPTRHLRALIGLYHAAHGLGRLDEFYSTLHEATGLAEKANASTASEFLAIMSMLSSKIDPELSGQLATRALERLMFVSDNGVLSNVYRMLGRSRESRGNYESGLKYFYKSLEFARKSENLRSMATILCDLGSTTHFMGRYAKAAEYLTEALELQERIGDIMGMYNTLNNIGNAYSDSNRIGDSIASHKRALKIARKLGNNSMVATSQGNLGYALTVFGELDEALECHRESLALREEQGLSEGLGWSHSDIGIILFYQDRLGEALASHQRSFEIWAKLNFILGMALSQGYMGDIRSLRNEPQEAIDYYERAIELSRANDLKASLFFSLNGLARLGKWERLDELGELAGAIGREDLKVEVLRLGAEQSLELGELPRALELLDEAYEKRIGLENDVPMNEAQLALAMTRAKYLNSLGQREKAVGLAREASQGFDNMGRVVFSRLAMELADSL